MSLPSNLCMTSLSFREDQMSEQMLCAIPARGGSKRLARKNLRNLAGMPLIVHSIDVARKSGLFEFVYVCTEDQEIAEVARAHGASVPIMMPVELCGDLVASHVPCQHLAGISKRADIQLILSLSSAHIAAAQGRRLKSCRKQSFRKRLGFSSERDAGGSARLSLGRCP